jgi:hypothetical protein
MESKEIILSDIEAFVVQRILWLFEKSSIDIDFLKINVYTDDNYRCALEFNEKSIDIVKLVPVWDDNILNDPFFQTIRTVVSERMHEKWNESELEVEVEVLSD